MPAHRLSVSIKRAYEPAHAALSRLRELTAAGPVTLIFAARDADHSNAAVPRSLLLRSGD